MKGVFDARLNFVRTFPPNLHLPVCILVREDFTRLKKVVEKKREAAAAEQAAMDEAELAEKMAALAELGDDTLLDEFDAQEQRDVYF